MPYIALPSQLFPASRKGRHYPEMTNAVVFIRAKAVAAFENLRDLDLSMADIEKGNDGKDRASPDVQTQKTGQNAIASKNDEYIRSMKYTER